MTSHQLDAISDAVHTVITAHTGTDGVGQCLLYAAVGMGVVSHALGEGYQPVCGALNLLADPDGRPDEWFTMDPDLAASPPWLCGEYHCWLARQKKHRGECLDLSARHYPALVERVEYAGGGPGLRWGRGPAPSALYVEAAVTGNAIAWPASHRWVTLQCRPSLSEWFIDELMGRHKEVVRLSAEAIRLLPAWLRRRR